MAAKTSKWTITVNAAGISPRASAKPPHLPFGYYSSVTGIIYVQPARRKVALKVLQAHIEKGFWHFILPPRGGRGQKKVKAREKPLKLWDPTVPPSQGDVKLTNGECVNVTVQHKCEQMPGTTPPLYFSTPAVTYGKCTGRSDRPCADTWEVIFNNDQINIYKDSNCEESYDLGGKITISDWTCLEL
jgi:hypothetical protein